MAHQISMNNGRAELAYSGETPWHGLGTKVDGLQTATAMLQAAGLEWTVEARDLFRGDGSKLVEGFKALVRVDRDLLLGVTTDRYMPIQNAQAGDIMDALVTAGGAHVEVAGALGDGERCWMLAHIPADFEVVKGDMVRPYMLLAWGHDGKHGVAGKLTSIRVVCNNTLTAAGFGGGAKWSASADLYIRHSKNATVRIEDAQRALGLIHKQVEATNEAYSAMAATKLEEPRGYFSGVFPPPTADQATGEQFSQDYQDKLERWNAHQAKLLELYEGGSGAGVPGVAGTVWAGYNAVTEWTDHVYPILQSGKVSEVRQQSVLFGAYSDMKRRAFSDALALVG